MPLDILTNENPEGRRILLLDLVWTLAHRKHSGPTSNYGKVIWETEEYRTHLIDRVLHEGFYVIMLTARSTKYQDITLENIMRHTNWVPDVACFNEDNAEPPTWKQRALHRMIFPKFGWERERYFALESNGQTRAMYAKEMIEAQRWEDFCGVPRKEHSALQGLLPNFKLPEL